MSEIRFSIYGSDVSFGGCWHESNYGSSISSTEFWIFRSLIVLIELERLSWDPLTMASGLTFCEVMVKSLLSILRGEGGIVTYLSRFSSRPINLPCKESELKELADLSIMYRVSELITVGAMPVEVGLSSRGLKALGVPPLVTKRVTLRVRCSESSPGHSP